MGVSPSLLLLDIPHLRYVSMRHSRYVSMRHSRYVSMRHSRYVSKRRSRYAADRPPCLEQAAGAPNDHSELSGVPIIPKNHCVAAGMGATRVDAKDPRWIVWRFAWLALTQLFFGRIGRAEQSE